MKTKLQMVDELFKKSDAEIAALLVLMKEESDIKKKQDILRKMCELSVKYMNDLDNVYKK